MLDFQNIQTILKARKPLKAIAEYILEYLIIELKIYSQKKRRDGEMTPWLRVLADLPEDRGSIPSAHMAAHNCL